MDKTKPLVNESILFAIEHLRKKLEDYPFTDQKKNICESIEILTRAYQNVNNENLEEQNNEKI